MPDSPTSEPESPFVCDFVCDYDEFVRSACAGESFYAEHDGKRYCVLHFPSEEKSADFEKVFQRKLENKDFNFRGVWFPEPLWFYNFDFDAGADFSYATFSAEAVFRSTTFRAEADFSHATFSAEAGFPSATFSAEADFRSVTFNAGADFRYATFRGAADFSPATFSSAADFGSATFSAKAGFNSATFSAKADFTSATFGAAADFSHSKFSSVADFAAATFSGDAEFSFCTLSGKTDFSFVTFTDYVKFAGSKTMVVFSPTSSLDLQFARIEKPDHLSFHTLTLRPHWLVNVDARESKFINVKWHVNTAQEIKDLKSGFPYSAVYHLLAVAFWQLAVNAEDNHRYEEASRFRYMAMDVRRRERWHGLAFWRLDWWYWLASGYGERALQAFLVLLGILLLSASLYNHVGFARLEPRLASESDVATANRDDVGAPLTLSRALTYSAGVMTLQKPEPRPATTAAQTVVLLETVLGPVQAALLALAIRRKFMR